MEQGSPLINMSSALCGLRLCPRQVECFEEFRSLIQRRLCNPLLLSIFNVAVNVRWLFLSCAFLQKWNKHELKGTLMQMSIVMRLLGVLHYFIVIYASIYPLLPLLHLPRATEIVLRLRQDKSNLLQSDINSHSHLHTFTNYFELLHHFACLLLDCRKEWNYQAWTHLDWHSLAVTLFLYTSQFSFPSIVSNTPVINRLQFCQFQLCVTLPFRFVAILRWRFACRLVCQQHRHFSRALIDTVCILLSYCSFICHWPQ